MSMHVIKVPDLGEGIVEAELVAWHVKPGDLIKEDQPIADLMTDKASVEIPSPVAGRVLALGAEPGTMMRTGAELIRIDMAEGGAWPVEEPASAAAPPQAAPPLPILQARPAPRTLPLGAGERPIASPAVRRRAWELGVELRDVNGRGPGGRILQADLDEALARGVPRQLPAPAAAAPVAPAPAVYAAAPDTVQNVPVIGMRRRIAMKMQAAKRQIPHFTYVEELDVTELEALRRRLNADETRPRLTLLPFLMRAIVRTLRDFPQLNARFDDEKGIVARHAAVHLGVATQTNAGLLVPVVKHAEALDLWGCAREVARLAEAARAGVVTRDELSGSTITITSLGPLGGIVTTPIINAPEVAIVGVNRIVERLVLRDGAVQARQTMNLSSSFDHRVVDGMDAARFIQAVRALLETPATIFL
jgi:2-oxoisovalerate dehydrogenase E2 component (dihydrolipoyl transacylase)